MRATPLIWPNAGRRSPQSPPRVRPKISVASPRRGRDRPPSEAATASGQSQNPADRLSPRQRTPHHSQQAGPCDLDERGRVSGSDCGGDPGSGADGHAHDLRSGRARRIIAPGIVTALQCRFDGRHICKHISQGTVRASYSAKTACSVGQENLKKPEAAAIKCYRFGDRLI